MANNKIIKIDATAPDVKVKLCVAKPKTASEAWSAGRDKTHREQIERWANFVKNNPKQWKPKFKEFIDAQILISRRFYKNLMKTPGGREKIKLLRKNKQN